MADRRHPLPCHAPRLGRSLALPLRLALSPQTIPIPGFRTVKQVEENVAALRLGPLAEDEVRQIAELLR